MEKPATIDEYIAAQPAEIQPILFKIRETIRDAAPDAIEKIAWQMPTFWAPAKSQDSAGREGATKRAKYSSQSGTSKAKPATAKRGENLIHFAALKNHIGLYPGGEAVGIFADRLTDYKTSKGAIQFPFQKPIDYALIADITRWRVRSVENKNS